MTSQTSSTSNISNDAAVVTQSVTSETKKIFHLINGEHFSGAERVQDLLASALPQFGYHIGFGYTKEGIFSDSRSYQEAPLHDCVMRHRLDRRAVAKAISYVRENQYCAVHAHTPRSLMVGASVARKLSLPLIYHVHSPVGRDSNRRFKNWINTQIENRNLRRVDAMICVSSSLKEYMKELGHPEQKLFVVPNGVPCVDEVPERPTPSAPWVIGTVALFRPRKGTEVLLEAVAELKSRGVRCKIHAVGPFETPEYEKQIHDLATQLEVDDLIEWTGFTKNALAEFPKMDLFVLPSLFGEGLPMVVLEAMASGVPVVAADVEGIPQALRHETDGLIFEPGNPSDLADKLQRMIEAKFDWQAMRNSALQRHRDHFSEISMARGVADVYQQIVG